MTGRSPGLVPVPEPQIPIVPPMKKPADTWRVRIQRLLQPELDGRDAQDERQHSDRDGYMEMMK